MRGGEPPGSVTLAQEVDRSDGAGQNVKSLIIATAVSSAAFYVPGGGFWDPLDFDSDSLPKYG